MGVELALWKKSNFTSSFIYCDFTYNNRHGLYSHSVISPIQCTVRDCKFIGNYERGCKASGIWTITDSLFEGNSDGGLEFDRGNVTNCTFRNNTTSHDGYGGGVYGHSSDGNFINCIFVNNTATKQGGGFWGWGTLENCIFTGNTANYGGGLNPKGTIKNSTISGNTAIKNGGGIFCDADATITGCNITKNNADNGGGIFTDNLYSGTFTITACSITDNEAGNNGGGVCVVSPTKLINSTITGNSAGIGAGVYTGSSLTVTNCTLANNNGSEFFNAHKLTVSLVNTILYNSQTPYIFNENKYTNPMTLTNCAFAPRSIYGSGNTEDTGTVSISDWSASHKSQVISVDNVAHTVFKLNASDTALIHGGTNKNAPEKDQLGKSRNTANPSIGAVEYSSGSGNNPDPNNGNNNNTPPETPNNGNNDNTSPEAPSNGNTPQTNGGSGGGGGGCNSFCGLITLAILFALKRR